MLKKTFLILIVMAVAILPTKAQTVGNDKGFEISKNLEIFANIYKNIHLYYVDDVDPGATMKAAINAMLASLDPYTVYYPESDIEDVRLQLMGEYGGIGALVHQKEGSSYIAEPYEGLPADLAGLKAGDRILEVNGESTKGKDNAAVSSAMRGQAGTTVTLKLEREGQVFEKTITRKAIKLPNVPYYGMVQGNVGYVKLDEFTQDAAKNVRDAFRKLKAEHPDMNGFILDLRGNGGGLLNEAVDLVNVFVRKGELIVETKGKVASKNLKSYTRMASEDTDIPVAVLMDGYSASASEITAGSLQDLDRAVIIGGRSFGKGLVQNVLPMPYNTQMKVTVSKYYIPSGRCIQAIDYSHRDDNGKASKVPDSLKTAFKTRNGRVVYDGFGIEPDVEMEVQYMSRISMVLVSKFLFFDYATKFVKEHPSISPAGEFEITDEIYQDFKQFLVDKSYEYTTETEEVIKEMREAAKYEKYDESLKAAIDALEQEVKKVKADDLEKNREELAEMLKAEILVRYYYQKGRIEGSLVSDKDVQKAVEILSDQARYKKLLGKR